MIDADLIGLSIGIWSAYAFWVCLALVVYIYIGYPVLAALLGAVLNRSVQKAEIQPTVTVLIAAFNEEREIESTVLNKLAQDYPEDRLDVIVVSDGSTDATDAVVRLLQKQSQGRVRLLRQEPRQGKTAALNAAIKETSAEIIVFSDANSLYASNTVRKLVRNFADPTVGYVTGRMVYTNPTDSAVGEGSGEYMSYENFLRAAETRLGSIVGVDGGVDALRRSLYRPMRADQLPDFVLPLTVVEQGRRVVYEHDAILYEQALAKPTDEFRMRVRVSLRALWALFDKRVLLNPLRYHLFAWQLLSHKVLRYGAFVPLTGLALFNVLALRSHKILLVFLALQTAAYATAAVGHVFRRSLSATSKVAVAPYYFVILNSACVVAFWKFVNGQKMVTWQPRAGAAQLAPPARSGPMPATGLLPLASFRRRVENLLVRELDQEMVVVDTVADRIHQLNQTAGFIWQSCDNAPSEEAIAELVAREFEVEKQVALRDVRQTLATLHSLDLLVAA
jgi:cellulose synthase/poly-beta-1,6-N-acetylglucosamine synthase-like glycosyltransferase